MIKVGLSGRVAHYFLNSRLTLLLVITALLAGVFAVLMTLDAPLLKRRSVAVMPSAP